MRHNHFQNDYEMARIRREVKNTDMNPHSTRTLKYFRLSSEKYCYVYKCTTASTKVHRNKVT